ncbi:MAG: UDP-N-acetylmuramoyl-L-alanyl-D-glutamate--2,6-diaminopimelate ligase [Firmicutes bacterium]|nr:UDP-N-acetylmuramoyl-L-alanyl-D-glutamate--2,6-diaminopimelate ligase [Bacillota bacterium]
MNLEELVRRINVKSISGDPRIEVTGIAYDSRRVRPGMVFVCITGFKTDGHLYIDSAVNNGAVAVVVEKEINPPAGVVVIRVANTRWALSEMGAAFYQDPSRQLRMVGVTGTNGKTTTTHLIEAILKQAGYKVGLIGTVYNKIGDEVLPVEHTTPESLDLQELLARMVKAKIDVAVMEVSSHALALDRVSGCEYDVAVFTNLTQDHLDFHQNLTNYLATKSRLFSELGQLDFKRTPKYAVINADDPNSSYLIERTKVPVVTYGVSRAATVTAREVVVTPRGTSMVVNYPAGEFLLCLQLTGLFNVYNALAAVCVGWQEGVSIGDIQTALQAVTGVPGRFELIDCGQEFTVIVDYAHTPDGLENILQTAREITSGRVLTVFGCGGDRDRTKRPLMGEVAGRYSDFTVITSDNPRTEDPLKIIEDIIPGMAKVSDQYEVIPDRRAAIAAALQKARPGDLVVIAGKGHETYQIIGNQVFPFDDREVAREILRSM